MKNSYYHIGGIFFGLMLTSVSTQSKAQTRTISGTITSSNKPLSGVIISQEGSDQVTMTTNNGTYTIKVSAENPILLFRHPDYAEEKVTLANQTVVNISLEQKVKGIEEVILNAGYYKVKDKERTGSIAKVSAKDIENQPVTNVLSAAQGRMAGVNIIQSTGVAGGGYDVQIRGRNSLRTLTNSAVDGNQPLYVLDGVPMASGVTSTHSAQILPFRNINPLNSINPNDIESFEILKDADATAIYGSRGANGVILITTKKGSSNKSNITINSSLAFSNVASRLKMMKTEQYIAMRKSAFVNDNISAYPSTAYDVNGAWEDSRYTDWQKALTGKTATASNTSLGLSGGSDGWTYRINLTHSEQTTVYPADYQYKSNNLSMGFTHRSKDKKLNIAMVNIFSQQFNNVINEDLTNIGLFLSPNAPELYKSDGSLNWQNNTFTNPMAATVATYQNDTKQINNSINVSYQILPNISFNINSGFNYQNFEEFNLRPHTRYNPAFNFTSSTGSSTLTSSFSSFSYNLEPQLTADYIFGRNKLNVLVGATINSLESKQSSIQGSGFENNALMMNINAAKTKIFSDIISTDYKYIAAFGRINYQFDGKYIVNLTARRDGSSRFGPDNRFASFGALGAAWLFSKESFLSGRKWLSFGKIRGSYGIAGSDNIGDAQFRDTYSVASASIYNGVVGLVPTRLFNGSFSWEKTKKLEFAVETSFFKDVVGLNISWFRNRSDNQLVGLPLPSTTGFSSVQANLAATVENKGWEFEFRTTPIKTNSFSLESNFNLTIPRNRLLEFPNLEGSTYANQFVVGYSTSIVKLFNYTGINPSTGSYSFTDVNGDGKISSPDDNKSIEDLSVKFYGGWSNRLRYKNWDLSFLFQFTKQKNYNYHRYMPVAGTMNNQPQFVSDVWSEDNPNGYYMPFTTGVNASKNAAHTNFTRSTASVSDASFIRLKNIQVNYRLPLKNSFISAVTIYAQGQNVLTWTKYLGLDPEFVTTGYLPPLRTWSIGTQINF
ncbi:SusC/RagA family TonB-linked outer membrane protein [Chryseobacterium sp. 2987]|uniref:SusC/RagA family TonB-linked outer membrane protein n=1 Tax=Chryseobacterium sp. 2987 TaxID=2817767 RepID=UPI00285A8571|nr:SusC/RagA family TonB-linked outer membrane protein [Chryseobacterium sp. 2987]MDR6919989.1 TonB-linked SusC/RagA family outer membrane protein [Chryseobacterium sp. 2987]